MPSGEFSNSFSMEWSTMKKKKKRVQKKREPMVPNISVCCREERTLESMMLLVKCTVDMVITMSRTPVPQSHEENDDAFSPGVMLRGKWLCIICATFNDWNISSSTLDILCICLQLYRRLRALIRYTTEKKIATLRFPIWTTHCHTNQHPLTCFISHAREHATFTTPRR